MCGGYTSESDNSTGKKCRICTSETESEDCGNIKCVTQTCLRNTNAEMGDTLCLLVAIDKH